MAPVKDVNVWAPLDGVIKTMGAIPIVITRGDVDRNRVDALECRFQETSRVWCKAVAFIKISTA